MKKEQKKYYNNDSSLRNSGYFHQYSADEITEMVKCSSDFMYFCAKYIKVVDADKSVLIPFNLYEYQQRMFKVYNESNRIIVLAPRQSGKSVFTIAYLLWYAIFNELKNIVLIANKEKTAKKTLKKLKEMYRNLPFYMKQGILEWNQMNISFENGSNIYAEATSVSGNRGDTVSILYIDEAAIIPPNLWEEFYTSVYPTISAVKSAKIIISSTPKGYNFFYNLWNMSVNKQSDYKPFRVYWDEIPDRDEKFKEKTINEFGGGSRGLRKWKQEYECSFVGSGGSLIESSYLEKMNTAAVLESTMEDRFLVYENPVEKTNYIVVCDVGEGGGGDYSTCHVLKIKSRTELEQVACYRDNNVKTNEFDLVVKLIAENYNNALVIIESNSYGREILNRVVYDDDYENVYYSYEDDNYGIRMTKSSKKIGNSFLKSNIETGKFIINDFQTIKELSTYVKTGDSYAADKGQTDDMVTPLVILSYFLSNKKNIEDWINTDFNNDSENLKRIENELIPFGYLNNGATTLNLSEVAETVLEDDRLSDENETIIFESK